RPRLCQLSFSADRMGGLAGTCIAMASASFHELARGHDLSYSANDVHRVGADTVAAGDPVSHRAKIQIVPARPHRGDAAVPSTGHPPHRKAHGCVDLRLRCGTLR